MVSVAAAGVRQMDLDTGNPVDEMRKVLGQMVTNRVRMTMPHALNDLNRKQVAAGLDQRRNESRIALALLRRLDPKTSLTASDGTGNLIAGCPPWAQQPSALPQASRAILSPSRKSGGFG
jgi:hypothetical protein